jgi:predicted aspartyl protease
MNPGRYPSLNVRFTLGGTTREVSALVDTGFEGYFAVPTALVAALPSPNYQQRAEMANGQILTVDVFRGTVELADTAVPIRASIIALGDEFLLGLLTINHFRVTFDHGRRLIVEP